MLPMFYVVNYLKKKKLYWNIFVNKELLLNKKYDNKKVISRSGFRGCKVIL